MDTLGWGGPGQGFIEDLTANLGHLANTRLAIAYVSILICLPQVWKAGVGERWCKILPDVEVDVQVEATLTSPGLLREGLRY